MSTLRDETLSDLLKALWMARVYLLVGGIIGFCIATLIVLFSVPHMRSIMVVAPTTDIVQPANASLEQTYTPQETIPFLRYLKILTGPNVVDAVLKKDQNLQNALQKTQRFTFQKPKNFKNAEDISAYLSRQIVIKPVGDTPLRTIEFEHPNPALAREILRQLHETADTLLRMELLARTENRLSYLKETLAKTANPDHRQALTNLLMEQERQSMMNRMDKYYAATLVEPPYINPKPVWPRKSYIFPLLVLVGMLGGWIIYGVAKSYEPDPA